MTTTLERAITDLDKIDSQASFVELQIHDKLKTNLEFIKGLKWPSTFSGHISLHGEGETDGKKRIKFSSPNETERRRYVLDTVNLYSFVIKSFYIDRVQRIILHPDTFSYKVSRKKQIASLVTSLLEIRDKLKHTFEYVCIEPRGGDRQKKVLRAEIEDIETLEDYLGHKAAKEIGLCIDIAQLFVVHDNSGTADFLHKLHGTRLPVKEFHISDVVTNNKVTNRVAMEVGTGNINWNLILPFVLEHCNDLLIETLGGLGVYLRSKSFLESLVSEKIRIV